jgi:hypothetical protein
VLMGSSKRLAHVHLTGRLGGGAMRRAGTGARSGGFLEPKQSGEKGEEWGGGPDSARLRREMEGRGSRQAGDM